MENYIWKIQVRLHWVVLYTTANTGGNVASRERKRGKRNGARKRKKMERKVNLGVK